ncbi:hypothetical protein MKX01_021338 [Papaver californicum]|nr:hypothetical protein MKX01_021338 [Papaver californicum]
MGYWGGVHPDMPETKKYNSKLINLTQSTGNLANMRDLSMDCMENYGIGVIDPDKISEFYDDQHSYLVSQETVATGLGGRVSLTRQFQQALEKSIAANFQDNSIICCMAQSTDSVYQPTKQTLHIAAVSFNSIFLGEVVVPDWDMFYVRSNLCYRMVFLLLFLYFPSLTVTLGECFRASIMQLNFMQLLELWGGCGVYIR